MTLAEPRARKSRIFAREKNDHYAEPFWVSERLFESLNLPTDAFVIDPACGWGRIVHAARKAGHYAVGSDIVPRWENSPDVWTGERARFYEADFFGDWPCGEMRGYVQPDLIASNPPYARADEFLELALRRTRSMVALILPATWLASARRAKRLAQMPLYKYMPISPRPSMPPGDAILSGVKASGGTTDYAAFVFLKGYRGAPQVEWLMRDGGAK